MSKTATTVGGMEPLRKSVAMDCIQVIVPTEIFKDFGLSSALSNLRKALTAGSPSAAPSSLTGGEALQKESISQKVINLIRKKRLNMDSLRELLPNAEEKELQKIIDKNSDFTLQKNVYLCHKIFEDFKKNKNS